MESNMELNSESDLINWLNNKTNNKCSTQELTSISSQLWPLINNSNNYENSFGEAAYKRLLTKGPDYDDWDGQHG